MGPVYLAEPEGDVPGPPGCRQVALKLFHSHLLGDVETERRFLQEASLGARLDHENVVRAYGGGTVPSTGQGPVYWLAMEYVRGQTLRELLREIGPFPEPL